MTDPAVPAWHQALVYALTGRRDETLGHQAEPDVELLAERLSSGAVGAFAVPEDLMAGLGHARFWAVVSQLRARQQRPGAGPVVADRPLTSQERRLSDDAPPHHLNGG